MPRPGGPAAAMRGLEERGRSQGGRQSGQGGRRRERRRSGTLVSQEGLRAAGGCSLVLSDPLRAVRKAWNSGEDVKCR